MVFTNLSKNGTLGEVQYKIAVPNDAGNLQYLWGQSQHAHSYRLALLIQAPKFCAQAWKRPPMNDPERLKLKGFHNQVMLTIGLFLHLHHLQVMRPIARGIARKSTIPRCQMQRMKRNQRVRFSPQVPIGTPELRRLDTMHSYQILWANRNKAVQGLHPIPLEPIHSILQIIKRYYIRAFN